MSEMQRNLLFREGRVRALPPLLSQLLQWLHPMQGIFRIDSRKVSGSQLPNRQSRHRVLPNLFHQLPNQPFRGLQIHRPELQKDWSFGRLPIVPEGLLPQEQRSLCLSRHQLPFIRQRDGSVHPLQALLLLQPAGPDLHSSARQLHCRRHCGKVHYLHGSIHSHLELPVPLHPQYQQLQHDQFQQLLLLHQLHLRVFCRSGRQMSKAACLLSADRPQLLRVHPVQSQWSHEGRFLRRQKLPDL